MTTSIDPRDARDYRASIFLTGGRFGVLQINGLCAVVEYDAEIEKFHAVFRGLNGVANFYGGLIRDLQAEGVKALKDFKQTCDAEGIAMFDPNAPGYDAANIEHIEASLASFDNGDFDTVVRVPSVYDNTPCLVCDDGEREDRMTHGTRDIDYEYKGVTGKLLDVTGTFCDACDEIVFTADEGTAYGRSVSAFKAEVAARAEIPPPLPGVAIADQIKRHGLTVAETAHMLGVAPATLRRVIKGQAALSAELAVRIGAADLDDPYTLLMMQGDFDLWHARRNVDVSNIKPLPTPIAYDEWQKQKGE